MTETRTRTYPSADVRVFRLRRDEDVSGVSGTGYVATGTVTTVRTAWDMHPTTRVVLIWLNTGSVGIYSSLAEMLEIHGHNGGTIPEFVGSFYTEAVPE